MSPAKERPSDPRLTDAANGARLVKMQGENIRYVSEWKQWVIWDRTRWRRDTLGEIMELAKETAASIYGEAQEAAKKGDSVAGWLAKWATDSLNMARLNAMVKAASTVEDVAISATILDRSPWLLATPDGTVDLRTGDIRPADPADLITKSTAVGLDPGATCPQWEAFIRWAMLDRDELVEYVQRTLGYSLTGDVSERLVFFLHGSGRNGKSTLLKVFRHILGDYAIRVKAEVFEKPTYAKGSGGANPDIADLHGVRFVSTSEVEDGTRLATALLKDLVGDETLRARDLYKSNVEFMPEFKPWIGANFKPSVSSDDQAIWDRLRLIPFDARVEQRDVDRQLGDKLKAEGPGILAWALRGCLDWQAHGLTEPGPVMEATAAYRDEMNIFPGFLESIMESVAPVNFSATGLREHYNRWARENDADTMSQRDFKAHMKAHGWTFARDGDRQWHPPAKKVTRVNFAEMARVAAARWDQMSDEERASEEAAYQAQVAAIVEAERGEALAAGFDSVEDMYEHERLNREAEAS